ncbi:hypothetical protein B7P43_G15987 [Cryptotermes secundus]|uniref:Gustatory receptor n=1 Tax=Cryptotermes secundus TaxID=105785 RepID=A0A2J7PFK4_9NEOP|nr:hypothetical protein B7P43_G15987 [Cryptotermes secundus]
MCRIWSIIWITLLAASEYISVIKIITASFTAKQKIVNTLFFVSVYSFSIFSIFLSLTVNRDKIPEILEKLSEIEQLFSTKKYRSQIYKHTRLCLILQFTVLISTLLTLSYFGIYIVRRDITLPNTDEIFFEILPMVFNSVGILYFLNLVLLLRNKYKCLNSELETSALTPCKVTNSNCCKRNCVTPIDTFRIKPSFNQQRHYRKSSRRQHFRNLRIIYSQLHDVALLINSTYGILLLCATVWVSVSIISGVNYIIEFKRTAHLFVIETVLWCSFSMSLMTVMTVSCSLAVNECNRSPVIVQKIMLHDDIDSEVMKELEMMFIQFKFMKIGFSACGMFRIDLPFLCGIFCATLSYLIIVSQL